MRSGRGTRPGAPRPRAARASGRRTAPPAPRRAAGTRTCSGWSAGRTCPSCKRWDGRNGCAGWRLVRDERVQVVLLQPVAPAEESQVDDEVDADHLAAELL